MDLERMKVWDWSVVGAFVATIIGVSIPWHGMSGYWLLTGWHFGAARAAFFFAFFALLWVGTKMFLPKGPLPKWYVESWPVLGFGGLIVLNGLVGTVQARGDWMPGGLITMFIGLAVVFFGFRMLTDKTGAYGPTRLASDAFSTSGPQGPVAGPPAGAPPAGPPSAGGPQSGPAFCQKCGSARVGDAAFCMKCGNPF